MRPVYVGAREGADAETVRAAAEAQGFSMAAEDGTPVRYSVPQPGATFVELRTPGDQAAAAELAGRADLVLVDALDWKVIPLENLIARYQATRTRLFAIARSPEEAGLFLNALERGVDGLLYLAGEPGELASLRTIVEGAPEAVALVEARVRDVRAVGVGERVCVDTCTTMAPGEGLLVGNQSGGLFLVHAECLDGGFVPPRPFRVNAGPVHAYVLTPGGRTRYLSELAAGEEVLVVSRQGRSRRALVGRVKIERRPLSLLTATVEGVAFSALLQNAETIRLVDDAAAPSVTALRPGDRVLVRVEEGGRHVGQRIAEAVVER
jgi:3-dehydroquinate synthase II